MKIKNELVSFKIGDKQYDFNNLILNEYLKRFVIAQLSKDNITKTSIERALNYCLIKFESPFETINGNVELKENDFDICLIPEVKHEQEINENQIIVQYKYEMQENTTIIDYKKNIISIPNEIVLSNYYNKKITAIGFASNILDDNIAPVCAVLDTSNYNIYLQENQEFVITRRDIITTDALFYTNNKNKVPGPAHLAPYGIAQILNIDNSINWGNFNRQGYGILHSIGLSSYTDYIDKEFIIGEDIQVEQNGTELNIKGIENYLSIDSPLFCSEDIYASTNLYATKSKYKYVILKYKVYQQVYTGDFANVISTPTDTGYYYYQAIPIDKFGKMNLKIKYERG